MQTAGPHTIDYWLDLARNVIVREPNDRQAIAELCLDAEQRNAPRRGLWHMACQYYGRLDRCPCFPCSKERGETSHLPEQPRKPEPPLPKTTWRRGRRIAGEAHLVVAQQKPWLALGMSRRTWYRRKANGEL